MSCQTPSRAASPESWCPTSPAGPCWPRGSRPHHNPYDQLLVVAERVGRERPDEVDPDAAGGVCTNPRPPRARCSSQQQPCACRTARRLPTSRRSHAPGVQSDPAGTSAALSGVPNADSCCARYWSPNHSCGDHRSRLQMPEQDLVTYEPSPSRAATAGSPGPEWLSVRSAARRSAV